MRVCIFAEMSFLYLVRSQCNFVIFTELGYEVHVVADGVSSSRWLDRAVGLQVT